MHISVPDLANQGFSDREIRDVFISFYSLLKDGGLFETRQKIKFTQANLASLLGDENRNRVANLNAGRRGSTADYLQFLHDLHQFFPEVVITADRRAIVMDTDREKVLRQLAGKLAMNLIDISTEFNDDLMPYDNILSEPYQALGLQRNQGESVRERFIAIVGAGASYAATLANEKPVPLARQAASQLRKDFEKLYGTELITEKIRQVNRLNRGGEGNLETVLLGLSEINARRVVNQLSEICGSRDTPAHFYEILAHLFKHRFVDVILNFNYDELLDNAIEEELPQSQDYHRIYLAGHTPSTIEELKVDNRIKKPIYVKCHGTISYPSSLRFQKRNAFVMEPAIEEHIGQLFEGKVPDYNSQQYLPLNLLIFGFGMRSEGLNHLLMDRLSGPNPEKVHLWVFDTDENIIPWLEEIAERSGNPNHCVIHSLVHDGKTESLATLITQLYDAITQCFQPPYRPQNIARHQLTDAIFGKLSSKKLAGKNTRYTEHYFRSRLLVEIAILVLKTNGFVHLGQIDQGRAGKYYGRLLAMSHREDLYSYLGKLGLTKYRGYMDDTFIIADQEVRNDANQLIAYVHEKLKEALRDTKFTEFIRSAEARTEFPRLAKLIKSRRMKMVNPVYTNIHRNIFSNVGERQVLNTGLAWVYNYRRNFTPEGLKLWNVLLAVTEEGSFLLNDLTEGRLNEKHLELVLATTDLQRVPEEDKRFSQGTHLLSGEVNYRPWWMHNKHMAIFLRKKRGRPGTDWKTDWEVTDGYFYTHYQLSRRINPVRLDARLDRRKLLRMFGVYWAEAQRFTHALRHDKDPNFTLVTSRREVDDALNGLLARFVPPAT